MNRRQLNHHSFPLEETMYFISIKNNWALKFLLFCIIDSHQQKNDIKNTQKTLTALDISPHLVANTYAKQPWKTLQKLNENFTQTEKNQVVVPN